jgi:hypothetical protein
MPSIDTAIYTRLTGSGGVAALVSRRVYDAFMPQGPTLPLVTFSQVSGLRDYVMGNQSGLVEARFQVDSWAVTASGARALAEQVRLALSNWHGESDTVTVDWCEIVNETRFFEDDTLYHRISQDYRITFRESLPV